MEKTAHIKWLDGLKGLACMGVFIHHFMLAFFNASYFGDTVESAWDGFDTYLASSPFAFLINGNFWVMLFIVICAYLPACRIMKSSDVEVRDKAGTMILRRYPRLMLPVLVVALLNFFLLHVLDATGLNFIGKTTPYGLKEYVKHSVFLLYFMQDETVIGPLWTMHYLFFGIFFAIILALPDKKKNVFMPFVYLLLLYPVSRVNPTYDSIVLGVLLADLQCFGRLAPLEEKIGLQKNKALRAVLIVLLLLLSLFLGAYPSFVQPQNIYRYLAPVMVHMTPKDMHGIAAFLLMSAVMLWNREGLPSLLSTKAFVFLGKVCMGIFLLHSLWIEYLGYYVNVKLIDALGSRPKAAPPLLLILSILIIFSAWIFHLVVEKPCDKLCSKIRA